MPSSVQSWFLTSERKHSSRPYFIYNTFALTKNTLTIITILVFDFIALDQCINSRPPLPYDLDGPGPWHYSPANKPLYETNAPEYSMGCKLYERGKSHLTLMGQDHGTILQQTNLYMKLTLLSTVWVATNMK